MLQLSILFGRGSLKLLCSSFLSQQFFGKLLPKDGTSKSVKKASWFGPDEISPFFSRFFREAARAIADSYWLSKAEQKSFFFFFFFFDCDLHHLWWTSELRTWAVYLQNLIKFIGDFPKTSIELVFFCGKWRSVWSNNFEVHSFILICLQGKVLPTIRRKLMAKARLGWAFRISCPHKSLASVGSLSCRPKIKLRMHLACNQKCSWVFHDLREMDTT